MNDVVGRSARATLAETTRRCSATNRNGDRCGRAPIVGGFVCDRHGGKAPQVRRSAEQRLRALADPAVAALERALESHGEPCEVCGRSDGDRDPNVIRAAQMVLDRCGLGPKATLALERVPEPDPWSEWPAWLTPEELADVSRAVASAKQRAQERMSAGAPRPSLMPVIELDPVSDDGEADDVVLIGEDGDA